MQDIEIEQLRKELALLARERHNKSPLKFYSGREDFEKAQNRLTFLALEESKNLKTYDRRFLAQINNFKDNPVFICGFFKAGTSMLNSLFDFHPQAVALPPGFRLFDFVRPQARAFKRGGSFDELAKHAVKMLYNPNGKFPMNLLNQGNVEALDIAPYAKFLAYYRAFIIEAQNQADILSAPAAALFLTNGQSIRGDRPKLWVEKTVANEGMLKLAKKVFPNAKFIYISRNPLDNLASVARWYVSSGRKKISNPYLYFWDLRASIKKAATLSQRNDFLVIRYEDLTQSPQETLNKICSFLGIEYDNSLQTPSVLGILDTPNISDQTDPNKNQAGKIISSRVGNYQVFLTEKQIKDIRVFFEGQGSFYRQIIIFFRAIFFRFLLFIRTKI